MKDWTAETLKPLGVFGPTRELPLAFDASALNKLRGALDSATRQSVSRYLLSGTTIFPLMKYTTDVLGNSFGVSGGSSIVSDGTYYWRLDAAEYVSHYGIGVGEVALQHMRLQKWVARPLTLEAIAAIDSFLYNELSKAPPE